MLLLLPLQPWSRQCCWMGSSGQPVTSLLLPVANIRHVSGAHVLQRGRPKMSTKWLAALREQRPDLAAIAGAHGSYCRGRPGACA